MKNSKNSVSSTDDGRKTRISASHPRMTNEKREKQRFRRGGKSESPNFCISNPLESQNHPFSALPTPWKSKNASFSPFGHGRRVENPKNKLSAMAERRKTGKATFRPRPKNKIQEKPPFGHGRRAKNAKSRLSATAER